MANISAFVEQINTPDGKSYIHVFPVVDGKPYPYFVPKSGLARRVAGLASVHDGIKRVRAYLKAMEPGFELANEALYHHAIATYARCFLPGDARAFKLEERDHLKGLSEADRLFHDALMHTRHNYVAHAGKTKLEKTIVQIILTPEEDGRRVYGTFPPTWRRVGPSAADVERFVRLAEAVEQVVIALHKESMQRLWQEIDQTPIDEIYRRAIFPSKQDDGTDTDVAEQ
jgi:hypothetical protein